MYGHMVSFRRGKRLIEKGGDDNSLLILGILLWEVWTGGRTPYPTFTNSQTMDEVMMGYRLERPKLCPPEIHTLMGSCWLTVRKKQ